MSSAIFGFFIFFSGGRQCVIFCVRLYGIPTSARVNALAAGCAKISAAGRLITYTQRETDTPYTKSNSDS